MKTSQKLDLLKNELIARLILRHKTIRIGIYLDAPHKRPRIERGDLKDLIWATLGLTDTHTVNSWIRTLVASGMLVPNPHETTDKRPTNETKYLINLANLSTNIRYGRPSIKRQQRSN